MTEKEGDIEIQPPAAQIRLTGKSALIAFARIITAESKAEPIFREMDMGRLARVASGNIQNVPGLEEIESEILQILAKHWYDERLREEDRVLTQKSIDLTQKSIRRSTIAIWVAGISAAAAAASAIAAIAAVS